MVKIKRQSRTERGGVAAVETALVIPLVLFLTLAVLDVCDGIFLRQNAIIAAQEGARVAIQDDATFIDVKLAVQSYLDNRGIQYDNIDSAVSISADPTSVELLDPITVTVFVDLAMNRRVPLPAYQIVNGTRISGEVTMLQEAK